MCTCDIEKGGKQPHTERAELQQSSILVGMSVVASGNNEGFASQNYNQHRIRVGYKTMRVWMYVLLCYS